jgi:hypothetical protein
MVPSLWNQSKKKQSHIVGYAFVGDTDLVQFDSRDPKISVEETLDKMQDSINCWEGGLKATGGAIVPQKVLYIPSFLTLIMLENGHTGR